MSLRIAITTSSFGASEEAAKLLEGSDLEIWMNPWSRRLSRDEVIEALADVDGVIAGLEPLDVEVLKMLPRLRVISRLGIGLDNVDLTYAKAQGIRVTNTPDGPTEAVIEMTLAAALALVRSLVEYNTDMHAGRWKKFTSRTLKETHVLVIGFGRIGQGVADRFARFGSEVRWFDPYQDTTKETPHERFSTLEDALRWAELVTLHASGGDCILGPTELSYLQPGAIVLNAARGGLVDEEALLPLVASGHLGGVWLDTFGEEPYSGPLLGYPSVLLTPHVGAYTASCRRIMEYEAALNLLDALGLPIS
jgi:D-3-phosphoglycerate dehydrogenase / 2-oxoglutarate reductase